MGRLGFYGSCEPLEDPGMNLRRCPNCGNRGLSILPLALPSWMPIDCSICGASFRYNRLYSILFGILAAFIIAATIVFALVSGLEYKIISAIFVILILFMGTFCPLVEKPRNSEPVHLIKAGQKLGSLVGTLSCGFRGKKGNRQS